MKIIGFNIKGFKNIKNVSITLDKFTALVGNNGYGKSNLIDAISFGLDFIKADSNTKIKMMAAKNLIPMLKTTVGNDYKFEIEFATTLNEENCLIKYAFSFRWQTEINQSKIVSEYLLYKNNEKNSRYNYFISRDANEALYRPSETGRCTKSIKVDDYSLVINKLIPLDELYFVKIIEEITNINFFIERHFDSKSFYESDPFVKKGIDSLNINEVNNIPRAVYYIKRYYHDKYELLVDAFTQLFPHITSLEVEEISLRRESIQHFDEELPFMATDTIYYLVITDDRLMDKISFSYLSDGTKRVFLMLVLATIAEIKGLPLIAIEEPENSIHPSLFQAYLQILNIIVDNTRIIITSHSPYIIQYFDPSRIYIGIEEDSGEANLRKFASKKIKSLLDDSNKYSRSVGDYIFSLLSSASPKEELEEYLE